MPNYFIATDFTVPLRAGFTTAAPGELTVGDFNGDGKADLMVGYFLYPLENRPAPIRVLAGDGKGGFTDITAFLFPSGAPTTIFASEAVMGDFNKDGRPDVFFADIGLDAAPFPGAPNTLVMSSGATGLIDASPRLPAITNNFSHSAEAADIDGDGDLDIFIGNGDPRPYFLINDGAGNFTLSRTGLPAIAGAPLFQGSETWNTEAFLDVDKDGDLDLFLGTSGATATPNRLFLNDGHGNFTVAPVNPPMPDIPDIRNSNNVDAKAFDVNGDGLPDVVSTFSRDDGTGAFRPWVQVLINNGDNTFRDETLTRVPAITRAADGLMIERIQALDIDGDGYTDLFSTFRLDTPILLNDGTGHFIVLPGTAYTTTEHEQRIAGDFNADGRLDILSWRGNFDGAENYRISLAVDRGLVQTGTAAADGFMGDGDNETFDGLGGDDVIFAGAGDDTITGGAGDDIIVAGAGRDEFRLSGSSSDYRMTATATGFVVQDLRTGGGDGKDTLMGVEVIKFADKSLEVGDAALSVAFENILRESAVLGSHASTALAMSAKVSSGQLTAAGAIIEFAKAAGATTSVAILAYQFFTGKIPGQAGIDYLVSPTGPNSANLNAAYYQSFNLENRYINFAVNLGREGEGKAKFQADYGSLSLAEATKKAYGAIFGAAPTDAKVALLLSGGRDAYFDAYGKDGLNGQGTKAAMVGWLLAEAVKADLGMYAKSNDAFLADLADGATFAVDLVGVYGKPEFIYAGG